MDRTCLKCAYTTTTFKDIFQVLQKLRTNTQFHGRNCESMNLPHETTFNLTPPTAPGQLLALKYETARRTRCLQHERTHQLRQRRKNTHALLDFISQSYIQSHADQDSPYCEHVTKPTDYGYFPNTTAVCGSLTD